MRYNPSTVRIDEPVAFERDEDNSGKNLAKHGVTDAEAEAVFFDTNRKLYPDPRHSQGENRRIIVGRTEAGRLLFVVFTLRGKRLRVISARDLNEAREAALYEEAT